MKLNPFHLKANPDNQFGSFPSKEGMYPPDFVLNGERVAFVNRSTKGKTRRKKLYPPQGKKTNIGDPCKSWGQKKKKKS